MSFTGISSEPWTVNPFTSEGLPGVELSHPSKLAAGGLKFQPTTEGYAAKRNAFERSAKAHLITSLDPELD